MSSASLAVAHRPHPDHARVAAMSAAIALNLAVIITATRPLHPTLFPATRSLAPVSLIRLIERPAVLPAPPPIELTPLPHPATPAPVVPHVLPVNPPVPVASSEGSLAPPVVTGPPSLLPVSAAPDGGAAAAPGEASLAYRQSPLIFPSQALRRRMQGTVLLRVLVDENGRPLQVSVEQGSGYALLDRSAREQVLAGWRFQPAMVDGKPVRAWAKVPVSFSLRQ